MQRILFTIPYLNINIWAYGAMMVIGFLLASQLAQYLAKRRGIDPELFVNCALIAMVSGIIGARVSHVLENIHQYTNPNRSIGANLFDAINVTAGGLTYYGGFIAGFLTVLLYAIWKKIPIRPGMDIVAPCVVIGLGFGRIGCFLNGCCYGTECELPWAVTYPYYSLPYQEQADEGLLTVPNELTQIDGDGKLELVAPEKLKGFPTAMAAVASHRSLAVHPAQLYSAFTAFLIAGVVLAYYTIPHVAGRGMAMMLVCEGTSRFLLESLRVEPAVVGRHFSLSMVIGLSIAICGVVLWFAFAEMQKRDGPERGFEIEPAVA